jgi:hypothetical protein
MLGGGLCVVPAAIRRGRRAAGTVLGSKFEEAVELSYWPF